MQSQMSVCLMLMFIVLKIGLSETGSVCKNRKVPSLSGPPFIGDNKLLRFRFDRATPVTCRNTLSSPTTCLFPFTDGDKIYDNCSGWESKDSFHCSFDLTAKQHFTEIEPCNPANDILSILKGPIRAPRFLALRGTRVIYAYMTQVLKLKCPAGQKITMLAPEFGNFTCIDGVCNTFLRFECPYECQYGCQYECCDYIKTEMIPKCNNHGSCNFTITSNSCLKRHVYIMLEYLCSERQNCDELVDAAGRGNQTEVEHYLHEKQCNVDSRLIKFNKLFTPLEYATIFNHIEIVKTLLSRGADRLLLNRWHNLPIQRVLKRRKVDIALLLLKSCDPNISWWQAVYQSYEFSGPASFWYTGNNEILKTEINNAMYRDRQRVSMIRTGEMEVQRTEWSVWGSCSVTCGVGMQHRIKNCALVDLRNGPHVLIGENFNDTRPCEATKWSSWGQWQPCSVTCGKGTRVRDRCTRDKAGKVNSTETEVCEAPKESTEQLLYRNVGNLTRQTEDLDAEIQPTSHDKNSTVHDGRNQTNLSL